MTSQTPRIELRRDYFLEADIDAFGMGAGVVPCGIDSCGNIHFLLGRERFLPSWKGSCRWSGFEGSRKSGETLRETAWREFNEESLAICAPTQGVADLDDHWIRIVLRVLHERRGERYHCTYALPVPYDPEVPTKFQRLRQSIEHVDRLVQEWNHARPVGIPEFDDIGDVHEDIASGVVAVTRWSSRSSPLSWPWQRYEGKYVARFCDICACRQWLHWKKLRERVARAVSMTRHDAIVLEFDEHEHHIQRVSILKDFMEKDQVRWWTAAELRDVLKHRGTLNGERFRPYFLPVLQTLLDESLEPLLEPLLELRTSDRGCGPRLLGAPNECAPERAREHASPWLRWAHRPLYARQVDERA